MCPGKGGTGAGGTRWSQKILITQTSVAKQIWIHISSIPLTNPVILRQGFPFSESFPVCEMGMIIPPQKPDVRLGCIEICTKGDQHRLAALHGALKERPLHSWQELGAEWSLSSPPSLLHRERGGEDRTVSSDLMFQAHICPCTRLDSPTTLVLITQAFGSSWDSKVWGTSGYTAALSSSEFSPPPLKRFMERLRGLFFNIY